MEARKKLQQTKVLPCQKDSLRNNYFEAVSCFEVEALDRLLVTDDAVKTKRTKLQLAKQSMDLLDIIQIDKQADNPSLPELHYLLHLKSRETNSLVLERNMVTTLETTF
jgi:hypothetical protein